MQLTLRYIYASLLVHEKPTTKKHIVLVAVMNVCFNDIWCQFGFVVTYCLIPSMLYIWSTIYDIHFMNIYIYDYMMLMCSTQSSLFKYCILNTSYLYVYICFQHVRVIYTQFCFTCHEKIHTYYIHIICEISPEHINHRANRLRQTLHTRAVVVHDFSRCWSCKLQVVLALWAPWLNL